MGAGKKIEMICQAIEDTNSVIPDHAFACCIAYLVMKEAVFRLDYVRSWKVRHTMREFVFPTYCDHLLKETCAPLFIAMVREVQ